MATEKNFGDIGQALLADIAWNQVRGVTRDELLNRQPNPKGAARRLGRLLASNSVTESLSLWETGEAVGLDTSALVMIRVDGSGLRRDARTFDELSKSKKPVKLPERLVVSQELLIFDIVNATRDWIQRHSKSDDAAALPFVVILDACVTHGGVSDIVMSAMATTPRELMRWVREVVNLAPHVKATQTIQVAYRHSSRTDRNRFLEEHPEFRPLVGADRSFAEAEQAAPTRVKPRQA